MCIVDAYPLKTQSLVGTPCVPLRIPPRMAQSTAWLTAKLSRKVYRWQRVATCVHFCFKAWQSLDSLLCSATNTVFLFNCQNHTSQSVVFSSCLFMKRFFFFLWSNQFNFAEGKPKLMHPLNTTEMHRQDTMCLLLRFLPSPLTIPQPVVMVTVAIITKFLWNWKDPSPWGTSIRWEGILVVTCCGQVSPFPKLSRGWLVILHNGEISSPFYWVNWSFSVSSGRQKLK